jgi:hypothetical protein
VPKLQGEALQLVSLSYELPLAGNEVINLKLVSISQNHDQPSRDSGCLRSHTATDFLFFVFVFWSIPYLTVAMLRLPFIAHGKRITIDWNVYNFIPG